MLRYGKVNTPFARLMAIPHTPFHYACNCSISAATLFICSFVVRETRKIFKRKSADRQKQQQFNSCLFLGYRLGWRQRTGESLFTHVIMMIDRSDFHALKVNQSHRIEELNSSFRFFLFCCSRLNVFRLFFIAVLSSIQAKTYQNEFSFFSCRDARAFQLERSTGRDWGRGRAS